MSGRKCKQITVHLPVQFTVHCLQIRCFIKVLDLSFPCGGSDNPPKENIVFELKNKIFLFVANLTNF